MCGLAAAAIGLQAVSGISQASQASQQGRYQQQVSEFNAQQQEAAAEDARSRGIIEAGERRSATRQQIGRQVTGFAGRGVDVSTGSPLDVVADTAAFGELDAQTIQTNAMREAYGYETEATNQRMQGGMARRAGRNQATSSLLSAGARSFSIANDEWGLI